MSKQFGGVRALNAVSLVIHEGEILGLAGENGAGKSTLFNIMTGVIRPDAGTILRENQEIVLRNLHDANKAGIFRVYQDQGVIPALPVYENVLLGQEEIFAVFGILNRNRMIGEVRRCFQSIGIDWIDPLVPAGELSFGDRQLLGIAQAVGAAWLRGIQRPLILFDEPTAAMSHVELRIFMDLLSTLRERGMTLVFVSHRLREILDVADRIYVMKDGAVVSESSAADTTEHSLHTQMVGRPRKDEYYHEQLQSRERGETVLSCENLSGNGFQDVTLEVHAGEILGIGGVTGSGKERFGRAVAGLEPSQSGTLNFHDSDITRSSARARIRQGVGYVPLDRHQEGAVLSHSVRVNMTLTSLGTVSRTPGIISYARERSRVDSLIKQIGIVTSSRESPLSRLSGGNQQKVVIGRVILARAGLIILDNPTRGVDAGAKHEIYGLIRELASSGSAVILITEDLPELIGLSNRVVIMRDGRVASIHDAEVGAKPSEQEVVAYMV